MNKLIHTLAEINRLAETSSPVIYDLSIDALARCERILKSTIPKNYEKFIHANTCACEQYDTCTGDRGHCNTDEIH